MMGHRRTRTIPNKRVGAIALRKAKPATDAILDEFAPERPKTRGDCAGGERPCPWVSCRYHLYLDAKARSIQFNHPDVDEGDLDRLVETCALDVADRGGVTLEVIARLLNLTRERVRQIEAKAAGKLARGGQAEGLLDLATPEVDVNAPMAPRSGIALGHRTSEWAMRP